MEIYFISLNFFFQEVLDPCSDYYVIAYMNREDVQEALHANVTKVNFQWSPCSDVITVWKDSPSSTLPILRQLMDSGIRVWVFRYLKYLYCLNIS